MSSRRDAAAGALAAGFLVFGIHVWVVANFGSATPYWDQWDADVAIIKASIEGTLTWQHFFVPHNEHTIAVTRLLALLLFKVRGVWDPILEMIANGVLHAAIAAVLAFTMARRLQFGTLLLISILLALPFGWENVLEGFQSQFYFGILFSLLALSLAVASPAFSPRWLLGLTFGVLTFFCGASGAVTMLPVAVLAGLQMALRVRTRDLLELSGLALCLLLPVILLRMVPDLPHHAQFRAHSLVEFAAAVALVSAWPLPILLGPLLHVPTFVAGLTLLRARPSMGDPIWFIAAGAVWVWMQYCALAYGRAAATLDAPRYLDLLVISSALGITALPFLRWRVLQAAWLTVLIASCFWQVTVNTGPQIAQHYRQGLVQTENVKKYLAAPDMAHLRKPFLETPYPDAVTLAARLDDPTIRSILPPHLVPANEPGRSLTNIVVAAEQWILAFGWVFAPFGAALMIGAAIRTR